MLQAYIDDSVTKGGVFVLAGAISSAERWAAFSSEWKQMLRHGLVASDGSRYFKMSEMAFFQERMDRVPWFYAILIKHSLCLLSYSFNLTDLWAAQNRVVVLGRILNWAKFGSPYVFAMRAMFDMFHLSSPKIFDRLGVPPQSKVDFILDERSESEEVQRLWDDYMDLWADEVKVRFGRVPRFESDQEFLPLQGADLWAWWVRRWEESGRSPSFKMPSAPVGQKTPIWVGMSQSEDDLFKVMAAIAARHCPGETIIDAKSGLPVEHERSS